MFKKALSYVLGLVVGLLAVAPPLNYSIPVVINSYWWLYGFIVAALFGMFLLSTDLPQSLKFLFVYLFIGCFISMAPYISFNAFILVVAALYCFLGFTKCDKEVVIDVVVAAFFVEVLLTVMQLFGRDKLMNFDRVEPVFLGTVFQYMRFGSLLAIMTPLLVLKNKFFLVPIIIMAIISASASFGLAIIAGVSTYFFLKTEQKLVVFILGLSSVLLFCIWDIGSVRTAFTCGRVRVWEDIVRTWVMNTSYANPDGSFALPLAGPVDWKSMVFGRGLDTFLPLFPIFKHDPNPFGQAHNCHLQLVWETGVVGYSMLAAYFVNLVRRVRSRPILVGGLACMAVNMFFAFPTRQTQCMLMMIAFMGICEQAARKIDTEGVNHAC